MKVEFSLKVLFLISEEPILGLPVGFSSKTYEGKIGEQAKAAWEANPEKVPQLEEPKSDDTYKKIGIGSLLGIFMGKLTGAF